MCTHVCSVTSVMSTLCEPTRLLRNEFSCPPPGDLPNPGMEPMSLRSPPLGGRFFIISTTQEAYTYIFIYIMSIGRWMDKEDVKFSPGDQGVCATRSHTRFNCKRKQMIWGMNLGFMSVLQLPALNCVFWGAGMVSAEGGFKNNQGYHFLKDWVPGNAHVWIHPLSTALQNECCHIHFTDEKTEA